MEFFFSARASQLTNEREKFMPRYRCLGLGIQFSQTVYMPEKLRYMHYEEPSHYLIPFRDIVVDLIVYSASFVLHLIYNR